MTTNAERMQQLDLLTRRKTIEDELKDPNLDPVRKLQLEDELRANEIPVSFQVQLGKVEAEIKECNMRIMENVNHIINLNVGREPDVSAHCESSAIFFQKKLETLTRTKELILTQIQNQKENEVVFKNHTARMTELDKMTDGESA